MDTVKKYGIKKYKAILLLFQMILTIVITAAALYLLAFAIGHNLGPWMIVSYSFILLSTLVIVAYGMIGFKKGDIAYILAIVPFLGAILVNILLPQRDTFQVAVLSILFALTAVFMVKQKDYKFNYIVSLLMCAAALTFSIYSAITARLDFLGQMSAKWYTYLAMYLSIFIPTIMSGTFALIYNVKITKEQNKQ